MSRHVKYLALCRDGKILASFLHWNKDAGAAENYAETLSSIFASPGWSALLSTSKTKLELKSGQNNYCLELDPERRVYVVVTTSSYPQRHIFSPSASSAGTSSGRKLMAEFRAHVQENVNKESLGGSSSGSAGGGGGGAGEGSLQRPLGKFLERLAITFDDLDSIDKIHAVSTQLEGVKKAMVKNIALADERQSLLDPLADKTRHLEDRSRALFSRSQSMKRRMCCRAYGTMAKVACIVVIMLFLAIGVVLALNFTTFHWFN